MERYKFVAGEWLRARVAPLNVLHVFAVVEVIFAWWHRLEAVVAAIANLRLGTLQASRLVYPVIEAG